MINSIISFLENWSYKKNLKQWKSIARIYRDIGESDHWIRARMTDNIESATIILQPNQTIDEYIEEVLSVLHEK